MERGQTISLSVTLKSKELKTKFLSSENYVKLLSLKRKMDKYINEMSEDEATLQKDHGIENEDQFFANREFQKVLKELQKKDFEHDGLTNFIDDSEFDKFVRKTDIDFNSCSILEEWLLKN